MKLTVEDSQEFLTLREDTVIQVMLESMEERTVNGRDGNSWDKLNFKFKIIGLPSDLEEEYGALIGSPIWGSTSTKLSTHPDNKLRQWAEALLDMRLDSGMQLDLDLLIGRQARAIIGTYTKTNSTTLNHKVVALLPANSDIVNRPAPASQTTFSATTSGFNFGDEPPF